MCRPKTYQKPPIPPKTSIKTQNRPKNPYRFFDAPDRPEYTNMIFLGDLIYFQSSFLGFAYPKYGFDIK